MAARHDLRSPRETHVEARILSDREFSIRIVWVRRWRFQRCCYTWIQLAPRCSANWTCARIHHCRCNARTRLLSVSVEQRRVALQVQRPAGLVVDAVSDGLPSEAGAIEVAVLELYACALGRLREKPHLDLAREFGVGFDLPPRADVPAEHDAVRRLEHDDPRPSALAAVDRAIVDVAPPSRLEHRFGDRGFEQVVLTRLEIAKALGEYLERFSDRRVHENLTSGGRRRCGWGA